MKIGLLFALMLLAGAARAAGCPEVSSAKVTAPSSVTVAIANTDLVVIVGRSAAGFDTTWTICLGVDDGTAGGSKPMQTACNPPAIHDWWIAMNDFRSFPGCPCPQWFWSWHGSLVTSPAPARWSAPPDTVHRDGPVYVAVTEQAGSTIITVDARTLPVLSEGRAFIAVVQSIEPGPATWTSGPVWQLKPAWTFTGTLTVTDTCWIPLVWSAQ